MTFTLQILIASAIFCVLVLIVLGIQKIGYLKHKAVSILLLVASTCFLMISLLYVYGEFSAYKKRVQRYAKEENNIVETSDDVATTKTELVVFEYFQKYRNILNGYEYFLMDMSFDTQHSSYQNSIKNKIIEQFENQEYSQNYWDKVFGIVFKQENNAETYSKSNYDAMFIIPKDNLEGDYGDLSNTENYNHFEALCNRMYIAHKIKDFDRSAMNIETLWKHNKAFIYTFFSKTKYDQLCKQVVDDLLIVHDSIVAQPQYKTFYEQYDVSDEEFLSFPSKKFTSKYNYSWPFSFWDRRFTESNDEQVYTILTEIQEHYK